MMAMVERRAREANKELVEHEEGSLPADEDIAGVSSSDELLLELPALMPHMANPAIDATNGRLPGAYRGAPGQQLEHLDPVLYSRFGGPANSNALPVLPQPRSSRHSLPIDGGLATANPVEDAVLPNASPYDVAAKASKGREQRRKRKRT